VKKVFGDSCKNNIFNSGRLSLLRQLSGEHSIV